MNAFSICQKSWQYWDISYCEILWIGLWTLFAWFLHHHFTVTKWRRLKKNYERIFNFSQKWEYYEIFLFTKKAITPNRRQRKQLSSKVGFRQQLFFFINVLKIHGTCWVNEKLADYGRWSHRSHVSYSNDVQYEWVAKASFRLKGKNASSVPTHLLRHLSRPYKTVRTC